MRLFRKRAKPTPAPRASAEIIRAYENNENITRDECRILYDLVDDPWDLGSQTHYESYARLIEVTDKYIDWANIDWVVDYGSGVGTFTKALKDAHPHIRSLGIDFDRARETADRRFGSDLFDAFYEMTPGISEYDLMRDGLPDIDLARTCICFINSTYYVFTEQRRRQRIDHMSRLMARFEARAQADAVKYLLVTANNTDRAAVDAIDKRGAELVYLSRDLELASRIAQFNSQLHTRVWRR